MVADGTPGPRTRTSSMGRTAVAEPSLPVKDVVPGRLHSAEADIDRWTQPAQIRCEQLDLKQTVANVRTWPRRDFAADGSVILRAAVGGRPL